MAATQHLGELQASIDRREIARLLGYPGGQMPARVLQLLADAERRAPGLVRPAGIFRVLGRSDFAHSTYLDRAERVVVGLVTIGHELEREVGARREEGQLVPALILDAYGSAAVEAAADTAERKIRDHVAGNGQRCSRRFSPGYGGWDVGEQRWILEALGGAAIGVTLTPGCMMRPRKSVTFAMTVGTDPIELRMEDTCAACGVVDCEWRDTPERCMGRTK